MEGLLEGETGGKEGITVTVQVTALIGVWTRQWQQKYRAWALERDMWREVVVVPKRLGRQWRCRQDKDPGREPGWAVSNEFSSGCFETPLVMSYHVVIPVSDPSPKVLMSFQEHQEAPHARVLPTALGEP